jgi:YggT family protein
VDYAAVVLLEIVYSATDPPIRTIRRLVPPLRLGAAVIDLSVLFVLLICYVLLTVNRNTLLAA